jgi:hypothetical protein
MKMQPSHSGVLVREVQPTCRLAGMLMPNDVLLAFQGTNISNDGTVPFRRGERIAFGGCTLAFKLIKGGLLLLDWQDPKT